MNNFHKKNIATLLLFSLILISCSSTLLNSEMIEKKFGSYGLDVIENNNEHRISFLFSNKANYIPLIEKNAVKNDSIYKKNYHTLALVSFIDSKQILDAHEEITKGGSIGATLKKYGWNVHKDNLFVFKLHKQVLTITQKWLNNSSTEYISVHVYNLSAKKENQIIKYAEIIELHHPDYLSLHELEVIYGTKRLIESNKQVLGIKKRIINRLSKEKNNQIIMDSLNRQL